MKQSGGTSRSSSSIYQQLVLRECDNNYQHLSIFIWYPHGHNNQVHMAVRHLLGTVDV
jgi:hypothetical protein